jgi:hypothetical protein
MLERAIVSPYVKEFLPKKCLYPSGITKNKVVELSHS